MICNHINRQAVASSLDFQQVVSVICLDCGKVIHCKVLHFSMHHGILTDIKEQENEVEKK